MSGMNTNGVCGTMKTEGGMGVSTVSMCVDKEMCGYEENMEGDSKTTVTCNSSAGTIVGAVVGVVVGLIACGIWGYCCYKNKKAKASKGQWL